MIVRIFITSYKSSGKSFIVCKSPNSPNEGFCEGLLKHNKCPSKKLLKHNKLTIISNIML